MSQPSTILIADLSGYTNFISTTELEHSSHILNELLELIVESEKLGLTVSEIEGDAVLFYKSGDTVGCNEIVRQCLDTYDAFHRRLKIIERDAICRCGACQQASDLGLKFVIHSGMLREISVANFRKASGLDMIVAHRLLKNDLDAGEYVLVTEQYLDGLGEALGCGLPWSESTQTYGDIGAVDIQFATLDDVRARIPDPPKRPTPVIPTGDNSVSLEIDAPLLKVYSALIDVEGKREWVVGLDALEHDPTTARIDERHICYFQGNRVDFSLVHGELSANEAVYSETATFHEFGFQHQQTYTLTNHGGPTTMRFEVHWGDDPEAPNELREMFMGGCAASFEILKEILER